MSEILKLEELNWRCLLDLPRERTLFLVPISPIEEHGPHLPLGCDLLDAEAFAVRTAAELMRRRPDLRIVLHPRLPLGTDTFRFFGSIEIRQRVIRDVAHDIGASLAREGFRHVVFMNGHGGPCHNVALEEACDRLWRLGVRAMSPVGSVIERLFLGEYNDRIQAVMTEAGIPLLPLPLNRDYHAGALETSLMMHLRPDLVTPECKTLAPFDVPLLSIRPKTPLQEGPRLGYLGAPAAGDPALGKGLLELLAGELADLCERLLDGADMRRPTRTRLYWIPLFWTNRWAWAATAAVLAATLAARSIGWL